MLNPGFERVSHLALGLHAVHKFVASMAVSKYACIPMAINGFDKLLFVHVEFDYVGTYLTVGPVSVRTICRRTGSIRLLEFRSHAAFTEVRGLVFAEAEHMVRGAVEARRLGMAEPAMPQYARSERIEYNVVGRRDELCVYMYSALLNCGRLRLGRQNGSIAGVCVLARGKDTMLEHMEEAERYAGFECVVREHRLTGLER